MCQAQTRKTVLVIGGRGFIGRHIVSQLSVQGARVVIGTRGLHNTLKPNERRLRLHTTDNDTLKKCLADVDVVINTVGILRQRLFESYEMVHHHAVARLANACQACDCRLIHISALGLNNAVNSRFMRSKRRGEDAIKRSTADWYIVRPSLVDGDGGYGAHWCRRVARWPVHLAPVNATGLLAPIDAQDLGEAVARLAMANHVDVEQADRHYDLGGDEHWTMLEYLTALAPKTPVARIKIPVWLARLAAHCCDLMHFTPYSYGHYELLQYDNYPVRNRLTELLGRPATRVGLNRSSGGSRVLQPVT